MKTILANIQPLLLNKKGTDELKCFPQNTELVFVSDPDLISAQYAYAFAYAFTAGIYCT